MFAYGGEDGVVEEGWSGGGGKDNGSERKGGVRGGNQQRCVLESQLGYDAAVVVVY